MADQALDDKAVDDISVATYRTLIADNYNPLKVIPERVVTNDL